MVLLVQMVANAQYDLSCFTGGVLESITQLKERLLVGTKLNKKVATEIVDELIQEADGNWRTTMYDNFQFCCQGIF